MKIDQKSFAGYPSYAAENGLLDSPPPEYVIRVAALRLLRECQRRDIRMDYNGAIRVTRFVMENFERLSEERMRKAATP